MVEMYGGTTNNGRPGAFDIRRTDRGDAIALVPVGELDVASAPILERELTGLCEDGEGQIVLDLSKLSFIDSSGIRAVLVFLNSARANGRHATLIRGSDNVQRVFELAGLAGSLPFSES